MRDGSACGTNSGAHPPQLADVIPPDQPFTRHLVNVDGLRLSVLEAGTGDPIIFVHGVVTTSKHLSQIRRRLFAGALRGIAADLRGYGDPESRRPVSRSIDLPTT